MELYKCTIDNSVFQDKEEFINHLLTHHMKRVEVDDEYVTIFSEFSNVLITGTVYDDDHTKVHFSVRDEETGEVFLKDTFYIYKDDSHASATYYCNHVLDIQEAIVVLRRLISEYNFLKDTLKSFSGLEHFEISNVSLGDITTGTLFTVRGSINGRKFEYEYFDSVGSKRAFNGFLKAAQAQSISGIVTKSDNPYKHEYVVAGVNLSDLLNLGDSVTVTIHQE